MKSKSRSLKMVECWRIDIEYTFGGFVLTFQGQTESGVSCRAKVEMHFCELAILAKRLWGAVKDRQAKVDMVRKALLGEPE